MIRKNIERTALIYIHAQVILVRMVSCGSTDHRSAHAFCLASTDRHVFLMIQGHYMDMLRDVYVRQAVLTTLASPS